MSRPDNDFEKLNEALTELRDAVVEEIIEPIVAWIDRQLDRIRKTVEAEAENIPSWIESNLIEVGGEWIPKPMSIHSDSKVGVACRRCGAEFFAGSKKAPLGRYAEHWTATHMEGTS